MVVHHPHWVRERTTRYLEADRAGGRYGETSPLGGDRMIPTVQITTGDRMTGAARS